MGELIEAIFPFFRRFAVEIILLTIALGIGIGSFVIYNSQTDTAPVTAATQNVSSGPDKRQTLMIEVSGAVNASGVYEMAGSTRLKDAIMKAGGLTDEADADYFHRNFNQARYLTDQEKIYVPSVREVEAGIFTEHKQTADYLTPRSAPSANTLSPEADSVNINLAEATELENLPGVGEATAAKIIQLRPYTTAEELLTKQAVKKNVFEQIKNLISL